MPLNVLKGFLPRPITVKSSPVGLAMQVPDLTLCIGAMAVHLKACLLGKMVDNNILVLKPR